jgi:hypothetical protein
MGGSFLFSSVELSRGSRNVLRAGMLFFHESLYGAKAVPMAVVPST